MDIRFRQYDQFLDAQQLDSWEEKYGNSEEYSTAYYNLEKFIVEEDDSRTLSEVINSQANLSGNLFDDEQMFTYSMTDEKGTLLGVAVFDFGNYNTKRGDLLIKYILVNPEFQRMNVASTFLLYISTMPEAFFGKKPLTISAKVDKENFACLKLMQKYGFSVGDSRHNRYYYESTNIDDLASIFNPTGLGSN